MSQQLKEEVWDLDRCTGCGLCVAVCNKGVLEFDESTEQHPTTKTFRRLVGYREVNLNPCRLCDEPSVEVCPRLVDWEPEKLGKVVSLKSRITDDVTKDLLLCGLELGAIDGVLATDLDKWSKEPVPTIFNRAEDLKRASLAVPLFSAGLKLINKARRLQNVAVVCPPCWAQGLKKLEKSTMQVLEPFQKPRYLKISYFCSGALYPGILSKIEKDLNIPSWDISKIEFSANESEFLLQSRSGASRIPMTELATYTAKGCARCLDFIGEQADIAIGTVASEPGLKTVIIRTPLGEELFTAASKLGYVELREPKLRAREELMDFIEAKRKRGSAVEVDKAFLSVLLGLKSPLFEKEALEKLESLASVKKKEV